ncbi:MAG TPA: M28 family peptidase, partial [Thermomicrobiaceae bacterium]|nr:M28 family peptidase [Thermomicrobiaceae bacterium]
ASMLETARILAGQRDLLRRELRLAFWSGHSHARYGTSAWFADEFWQDLHDHCAAHVNIDSPGGVGASGTSRIGSMAEAYPFARELFRELSGEELNYQRIGRGGDQSFWGVGVPSVCGKIYQQGSWDPRRTDLSGSFGWWWHTADDTMDKIDPANLARDAAILLAATYRVATDRVLPYDQTGPVDEIRGALAEIAAAAGDAFDLATVMAEADTLRETVERLNSRAGQPLTDEQARAINRGLLGVSRLLIPVNYTLSGPFGQDPALGFPAVPGLRSAARLAALPADSPERYLLLTALRRERNRVRAALIDARRAVETALTATA